MFFKKLFGFKKSEPVEPQIEIEQENFILRDVPTPTVSPIPQEDFPSKAVKIKCDTCEGFYRICHGKYGLFAGCSRYPKCKSTMTIPECILKYIEHYGINIYSWDRKCYHCGETTKVYSYFLTYDLEGVSELSGLKFPNVGLGDLQHIDEFLSNQIKSIGMRGSRKSKNNYMANTCEHCGVIQGRSHVVHEPREIIDELRRNRDMGKFLFKTIEVVDVSSLRDDIVRLYALK